MAKTPVRTAVGRMLAPLTRNWLLLSARTAVGAASSLALARWIGMPEAYWAAVTTVIVLQPDLGAAWTASRQRFLGTAVGTLAGGLLASEVAPGALAFGAAILVLGLMCAVLRLDVNGYRFAGVTLAIIFLVVRVEPPWRTAAHRFTEVSIGIAVALALTALWPLGAPPEK
jgi:uncharacterized membrane protein YccC